MFRKSQRNQDIDQCDRNDVRELAQHVPIEQQFAPTLLRPDDDPPADGENDETTNDVGRQRAKQDHRDDDELIEQMGRLGLDTDLHEQVVRPFNQNTIFHKN